MPPEKQPNTPVKQPEQKEGEVPIVETKKTADEIKNELKTAKEEKIVDFVTMLGSGGDLHSIQNISFTLADLEPETMRLFEKTLETEIGEVQADLLNAFKGGEKPFAQLANLAALYGLEHCFEEGLSIEIRDQINLREELENAFNTETDINLFTTDIDKNWKGSLGINTNFSNGGPEAIAALERTYNSGFLEVFAKQEIGRDNDSFVGIKGGFKF